MTQSNNALYSKPCLYALLLVFLLVANAGTAHSSTVTLHNFSGAPNDGANPDGALTFDAAGSLYGTTSLGGSVSCGQGCGTVYRLSPTASGWTYSVIYNFGTGSTPLYPSGALLADASGNFYGVAEGGDKGKGTVYQLSPGGGGTWTETTLYSFGVPGDGTAPVGKLAFDAAGNLWGVTSMGGTRGRGTVFELVPSSGGLTEKLIYSFPFAGSILGSQPSGIIFDSAGNLYGVTTYGGADG